MRDENTLCLGKKDTVTEKQQEQHDILALRRLQRLHCGRDRLSHPCIGKIYDVLHYEINTRTIPFGHVLILQVVCPLSCEHVSQSRFLLCRY